MLILLPPSEGKNPPKRGRPLDLDTLSYPELSDARQQAMAALARVSASPDALKTLKVGDSLAQEVQRNTTLAGAPTAPASSVYTGVLFEAAGLSALTGGAKRRANSHVRIISALWGALSPADRIPAYRLSMGASLPGLPPLARFWSGHLTDSIGHVTGVVLDCRSGPYIPAWTPPAGTTWLSVRVVQEQNGVRKVVSHHAKHTRGLLTGHLLRREAAMPKTAEQILAAAQELIGTAIIGAELHPAPNSGAKSGPGTLELVVE